MNDYAERQTRLLQQRIALRDFCQRAAHNAGIAVDGLVELIVQHNFRRRKRCRRQYMPVLHQINGILAPQTTETLLRYAQRLLRHTLRLIL